MFLDKFVCVFAAWMANAPADQPDQYLALMESVGTENEIVPPVQSSPHRWLVDNLVDQDGQPIHIGDYQFVTNEELLSTRIEAGKSVLSRDFKPNAYSTPESVRAQLEERTEALRNIQKAESGQDAQFCEFNAS